MAIHCLLAQQMQENTTIALDDTDLRILDLLQRDAALSNQDLAAAAHTSPATCLRRVRRLMEAGVIERRVAILSSERLGAGLTVLAEVTLDRQGAEHLAAFESRAVADPSVQQCYRVSPGPDFMLVMQVPDMAGYHALVQRLFTQDANVRNVKAFFSVHRAKFEPGITLPPSRSAPAPKGRQP
jgi:Lrp/AsnC family leucine-responsive transcriptional regulator